MNKKKLLIISILTITIGFVIFQSKLIQKMMHPKPYSVHVDYYSDEYNIDKNLVYSVMKVESKFNKNATSHKGAKGLMQISDITRDWAIEELELKSVDIYDPRFNIMIGCWYLNKLFKEFGDLNLVIAAYNGGSGNVTKWLNNKEYSKNGETLDEIPFEETSNYLKKVLKNYEMYNKIY